MRAVRRQETARKGVKNEFTAIGSLRIGAGAMRDFLLVLLLAGVCYLGYDDYSKRTALRELQQQLQQSSVPANQVRQNIRPRAVFSPTPPSWFQERIHEGSSLDGARQHKQEKERPDGDTRRP
jgi:hypothetical protein